MTEPDGIRQFMTDVKCSLARDFQFAKLKSERGVIHFYIFNRKWPKAQLFLQQKKHKMNAVKYKLLKTMKLVSP